MALSAASVHPVTSAGELRSTVLELWRGSTVREERYAAIELTSLRLVARDQLMLPVYEEIIRTGAWWDFVDGVSHLADPEFFIRKAIGWALREYAKTDPEWVRNFVMEKGTHLSQLSRKEALRHLEQGTTAGITGAG